MDASKLIAAMSLRMGKTRHETSAMEAPAPRSRITKAATVGMKAAPSLQEMDQEPLSSS